MSDYIVAEEYTLPSLGRVYSKEVNPYVKLRSMTVNEEMKRLNRSERPYKILTEIIDDCLVDKPGISAYDMCMGDYVFLLHKLRTVTYGPDYKMDTTCPYCGTTIHGEINLDDLEVKQYDEATFTKYRDLVLPKTQHNIRLKMQTPRMLDDIQMRSNDHKKSYGKDSAFLFSLQAVIENVDGEKLDPVRMEDFIRSLPMYDINYISGCSDNLSESIGLKAEVYVKCDVCGLDYNAPFRYTNEFFRPRIDG